LRSTSTTQEKEGKRKAFEKVPPGRKRDATGLTDLGRRVSPILEAFSTEKNAPIHPTPFSLNGRMEHQVCRVKISEKRSYSSVKR